MKRIILPLAAILASMCSCRKDDSGHQTGWFNGNLPNDPVTNLTTGDRVMALMFYDDSTNVIRRATGGITIFATKDGQGFDWLSVTNPNDFRTIWRTQSTNKWRGAWTLETNAP